MRRIAVGLIGFLLAFPADCQERKLSREEKVRADRSKVEAAGLWLYNDLPKAFQLARQSNKPILVVLRCIPCEECVKLDDDLVDHDPVLQPLLKQFVCVRVVSTNGLDLETFQFDTDQSFAMFMLNSDGTIYGRFGTRSHRTEWLEDVSLQGMARALEGALEIHRQFPANQQSLRGKRGPPLEFKSPERYPSLSGKYTEKLNYEGDVVKSCIHCHQIGDAQRAVYWQRGLPIPDSLMTPYPHPKSLGLILDPDQRAVVKAIVPGSLAEEAGLLPGDVIVTMQGQPILSIADVQWVLQQTDGKGAKIPLRIRRGPAESDAALTLPDGWRRKDDLSWRVTAWELCRIGLGGMRLESVSEQERALGGFLKVKHLGQYGQHGTAKRAGFQKGDLLISYGGRSDLERESDLFHFVNANLKPGDEVTVSVLREGKRLDLKLPIQE